MAERGAPAKKGLDYFPKMVTFYEDDKIFDLLEQYGPVGVTVYDVILTIVYSQGYYAEISKEKLARMIVRRIGSRWVKKEVAVQVIDFCADIGLLHDALLSQSIITSVGIQKRYYHVGVKLKRRRLHNEKFWLLDEQGEPLLNAPKNGIIEEENAISSEENQIYSEKSPVKEREIKEKERKESEREKTPARSCFGRYKNVCMSMEEYSGLVADFGEGKAANYIDRLGVYMKSSGRAYENHEATIRRWILQDEARAQKQKEKSAEKPNRFHNFDPVGYDYDAIVGELSQGRQEGE